MVYPIIRVESDAIDHWSVLEWSPSAPIVPDGALLSEIRIRIYGNPSLIEENHGRNIYLDGVCPNPPGIDPPNGLVVSPEPHPWQLRGLI